MPIFSSSSKLEPRFTGTAMWGPSFPELVEALPGVPIIDRSSVNAFDDPKVAQAIIATCRKKLIFAGISLDGARGVSRPRRRCQLRRVQGRRSLRSRTAAERAQANAGGGRNTPAVFRPD
jgi:hypothetical protein